MHLAKSILLLGFAGPALAMTTAKAGQEPSALDLARGAVAEGDADNDGALNKVEFVQAVDHDVRLQGAVFEALDPDHDGKLDAEPFAEKSTIKAAELEAWPAGKLHTAAISNEEGQYKGKVQRCAVTPDQVPWTVDYKEYTPVRYAAFPEVDGDTGPMERGDWKDDKKPVWADIADCKENGNDIKYGTEPHITHENGGNFNFDAEGCPRNPVGRTGLTGRGLLGKWGANQAADPIVTRFCPDPDKKGVLQMVAINRGDTGEFAIPGGMVDAGEHKDISATLKREFTEEAANYEGTKEEVAKAKAAANEVFKVTPVTVFEGYVDDPRNTDQAWMETVAHHFHCPDELGAKLTLQAGDDAVGVKWLDLPEASVYDNKTDSKEFKLYASHTAFLKVVVDNMKDKKPTA